MKYKGYIAAVDYDDSEGRLQGWTANTSPYPIATFEANDADAMRSEFERSIDEYLVSCEEDGVEPRAPLPAVSVLRR